MGKIVSCVFAALALLALVGVITGARHQTVLVAVCAFIALVAWPEKKEQINQSKWKQLNNTGNF